ncbi:MAG: ATP-binding cassette domain-containing protein, partial [Candidatus Eremiobacteraeota bacterium]|nr:ATP-binding cassette domain-containing protein [Candidatus Eremiobacteraeota bacterium]
MTPKLVIEHLTKSYGSFEAVNDLSLSVGDGSVFGLLGRNGAGKTTVFSCALGLMRPNSGSVLFGGQQLTAERLETIAYVPETPALFGWMTIAEHIQMQRRTYRLFDTRFAQKLVECFELPVKKRIRNLSKGQKTAAAIM